MRAAGAESRRSPLIAGILLAAGQSTRFGRPKLLERWQGQTLLRRAAVALLDGGLAPVVVVLPPGPAYREALAGLEVVVIENAEPERGIGHSIALAVKALPETAGGALIAVADQPLLAAGVICTLLDAFVAGHIVAPRYGSHTGNPRLFDRTFFPELGRMTGDRGGQAVAEAHPGLVIEVDLPEAVGIDIDRPSDWQRLPAPSED